MKIIVVGLIFLCVGIYIGEYGGFGWLSELKDKAVMIVNEKQIELAETKQETKVYIVQGRVGSDRVGLTTVKTFTGVGSKKFNYTVSMPLVFNASYVKQGVVSKPFRVSVEEVIAPGVTLPINGNILMQSGEYMFIVDATGYRWQIDLGKE